MKKIKIGTILPRNKTMQGFLRSNGFPYAVAKYIDKGSLRGSWRIYSRPRASGKEKNIIDTYDKWTPEVVEKLNSLHFTNLYGKPLDIFDGNGGLFSVFARFIRR